MYLRFLNGGEVMIGRGGQPESVDVEVRDHGCDFGSRTLLAPLVIDEAGGQEVGADAEIGIEIGERLEEAAGVRLLQRHARDVLLERLVGGLIEPAEHLRGARHHVQIRVLIHLGEGPRHQRENVVIGYLDARRSDGSKGQFHGLGGAHVSGANRGGEDQNPFRHFDQMLTRRARRAILRRRTGDRHYAV